jgi:alpha-beta hydrolase superfamily lysophospholipase
MMKTRDGIELFVNDWIVPVGSERRGSIMILHGIGEHCLRYNHVADFFNSLGFDVRSFDQRGFGRSEGKKSFVPYDEALVDDLKYIFNQYVEERLEAGDELAPLIFGHSMGGCIVASAVTGNLIKPRAMILSSPALILRLSYFQNNFLKFLYKFFPDFQFPGGLSINKLTHDKTVIKNVITDPYCHGIVTARIIKFMFSAGRKAIESANNLNIPVLLLAAGDDKLVELKGSKQFYKNLPEGNKAIYIYSELYHEILNEPPEDREKVFDHLRDWMKKIV